MRRFVALLAVCAIAVPAMADLTQTINLGVLQTEMIGSSLPQTYSTTVYANTDTNGYYTSFATDDVYKSELCLTTMTGAWTMDGFAIGVYVPAAGNHTIPVSFYSSDGYYPGAGNYIGGYNVTFTTTAAGGITGWVGANLAIPTADVWQAYGNPGTGYGVLHVNTPAEIGTDYFSDGWIEYDGAGYHWWWHSGNPEADIYCAQSTPEPATLALFGLCGLALLRRR